MQLQVSETILTALTENMMIWDKFYFSGTTDTPQADRKEFKMSRRE